MTPRPNPRVVPACTANPRDSLSSRYREVRAQSEAICAPLAVDDYGIQTIPEVSPPKWHLAHTTWFFETFLLQPFASDYRQFHRQFDYLFNSYYETLGHPYPRPKRGLLSRPTVAEIYRYRAHVDEAMIALLAKLGEEHWQTFSTRVILGLHHEQQHQELLLTDIKGNFAFNPLRPAYRDALGPDRPAGSTPPLEWIEKPAGLVEIGHDGEDVAFDFAFDNETPRHRTYVQDHLLASRLVTNEEYLAFMEDGGYRRPELWLADGWLRLGQTGWEGPRYWEKIDGDWWHMTLSGMRPVDWREPVCHVSFYEAEAFARWAGQRLPAEAEWECAAARQPVTGNLSATGHLHPVPASSTEGPLLQVYGDVWEWTKSSYSPYPGFTPLSGSLGEYNGKFMCNQMVLRGGACVTPDGHVRPTYRNFFYPWDRWQFTGIRLAGDPA